MDLDLTPGEPRDLEAPDDIALAENNRDAVLKGIKQLWGYEVSVIGIDRDKGQTLYSAATMS